MTTQTNAWALTEEEAIWVARATLDSPVVDKIAFRMIPGIGPEIVAVITREGGLLVPSEDGGWAVPRLSEPPAEFSAALKAGRAPGPQGVRPQ